MKLIGRATIYAFTVFGILGAALAIALRLGIIDFEHGLIIQVLNEDNGINAYVIGETSASRAFERFLRKYRRRVKFGSPSDYDIEVESFDAHTWIVRTTTRGSIGAREVFIADPRGFRPATLRNASTLIHEYHRTHRDNKPVDIIEKLVGLLDPYEGTIIISSTNDIPGYRERPLDDDLEESVRPHWQFRDERSREVVHVVYAWERLGGVVWRYRVRFRDPRDNTGRQLFESAERAMLGDFVGRASFLE